MAETYRDRDDVLRGMGFSTYAEYLDSALWASIRRRAYALYGPMCRLCPKKATSVHHVSYAKAVLLGLDLTRLAPLCDGCHWRVEFTRKKQKRTLADAVAAFKLLLRRARRGETGKSRSKGRRRTKR